MAQNYAKMSGRKTRNTTTPQSRPIPGREQEMTQNAAGGYSFTLDAFGHLERFLILGVEGGTIYQTQRELVVQNADSAQKAIEIDAKRVVDMVVDVLANGRSFKPDAGLFVLAMVASHGVKNDSPEKAEARSYALSKLSEVARTPTHLYTFANYVKDMRGWGSSLRKAFARWYQNAPLDRLAMHAWKYKSRDGFSHRDLMRLAHPVTDNMARNEVFRYMTHPKDSPLSLGIKNMAFEKYAVGKHQATADVPEGIPAPLAQIAAAEELLHMEDSDKATVKRAVNLIRDFRLTHEAVPGHLKNEADVWAALAEDMPVIAAVRNLAKMTSVGYISTMSEGEKKIVDLLTNKDAIQRSKAHPMQFLIALKQYGRGKGLKGSLSWQPSRNVLDALDEAYESAFGNVEVTGKRILLAVDDSGSMQGVWSNKVLDGLMTAAEAASAMAYITLRVEPNTHLIGYSGNYREIPWSRRNRVDDIMRYIGHGGITDTSAPMQYVVDKKLDVDAIVSYTDNNSWAGRRGHASEVLKRAEQKAGHAIRYVNVALEPNTHSDADPTNPNALELVGLDASTPKIVGEFVSGRL